MRRNIERHLFDQGATAVEFALIAFFLLAILGGIIDVGIGLHRLSLLTYITDSAARDSAVLAASLDLNCLSVRDEARKLVKEKAGELLGDSSELSTSVAYRGSGPYVSSVTSAGLLVFNGEFPAIEITTTAPLGCMLCGLLPNSTLTTRSSAMIESGTCFYSLSNF